MSLLAFGFSANVFYTKWRPKSFSSKKIFLLLVTKKVNKFDIFSRGWMISLFSFLQPKNILVSIPHTFQSIPLKFFLNSIPACSANCLDDVQKKPTLINNMQRINEMHLNLNFSSLMFNMYIVCTAPILRTWFQFLGKLKKENFVKFQNYNRKLHNCETETSHLTIFL